MIISHKAITTKQTQQCDGGASRGKLKGRRPLYVPEQMKVVMGRQPSPQAPPPAMSERHGGANVCSRSLNSLHADENQLLRNCFLWRERKRSVMLQRQNEITKIRQYEIKTRTHPDGHRLGSAQNPKIGCRHAAKMTKIYLFLSNSSCHEQLIPYAVT